MAATAVRLVYHVPIVGWMLKDAVHGSPDARVFFAINLVAFFIVMTVLYGYAFVISAALTATAVAMVTLIILTAGDVFDGKKTRNKP